MGGRRLDTTVRTRFALGVVEMSDVDFFWRYLVIGLMSLIPLYIAGTILWDWLVRKVKG